MFCSRLVFRPLRVHGALPFVLVMAILLSGCDLGGAESGASLDDELYALLADASPENTPATFLLPDDGDLAAIPQDPRNPLTPAKVELGKLLYHDAALLNTPVRPEGIATGSCASCHHGAAGFQAGRVQGIGEGGVGFGANGEQRTAHDDWAAHEGALDVQPIRTPSAMNTAYQELMLWNGQFGATGANAGTEDRWTAGTPIETNHLGYEGLETQAIAGLKVHRMGDVAGSVAASDPTYVALFEKAFPGEPIDRERAGLAIAAYERTLLANRAPFQAWLRGKTSAMTQLEKEGAVVFFGTANCAQCHTGPALSSMSFHALGMGDLQGADVFGPTGGNEVKGRASFTGKPEDAYAFKTPQLYNLVDSPFYGHGGTFRSVRAVVEYKNTAIAENPIVPRRSLAPSFQPLKLTDREIDALTAFLETSLYDADLDRYVPRSVPSGSCIPANDPVTQVELGC